MSFSESEKKLHVAFLHYLLSSKSKVADPDSIDVAIQVLEEQFHVSASQKSSVDLISLIESSSSSSAGTPSLKSSSSEKSTNGSNESKSSFTPSSGSSSLSEEEEAAAEAAKLEGNKFFSAGKHKQAIDSYSKAITIGGKNKHVYLTNRAASKQSLGDFSGALEDARSAVEIMPSWVKGHLRIGAALQAMGRSGEAEEAYSEALVLDPENQSAKDGLKALASTNSSSSSSSLSASDAARKRTSASRQSEGEDDEDAGTGSGSPFAGLGGLGGLGGIAEMLQKNPKLAEMAANMMKDPNAMQNLLNNPMMKSMMQNMGGGSPKV
jgi:small glutamine-rich tetratricopeptide repeat-containing protein alpha